MILLVDSEGPDQIAPMCRLILAFAVGICPKTHFHMTRLIYKTFHLKFSFLEWSILTEEKMMHGKQNKKSATVLAPVISTSVILF